jgi:hypothetical protein
MLTATVPWPVGDHCWDDIIDAGTRRIYSAYARPLGVGQSPAVLAINLYNLAFAGGDDPPEELQDDHPSSCGRFTQQAIAPAQRVLALARERGLPVDPAALGASAPAHQHRRRRRRDDLRMRTCLGRRRLLARLPRVVVEDSVFDRAWLPLRNLFDMHHKYADVVHSGVLRGLLERADSDVPVPGSVG